MMQLVQLEVRYNPARRGTGAKEMGKVVHE